MEKVSRKKKPVYPGFSFALVTGQKPNKNPHLGGLFGYCRTT